MTPILEGGTDWEALLAWYVGAGDLVADLDACRVIAESMLVGAATTNLVVAQSLSVLTQRSEQWLLLHPCPEPWNHEHVLAAVHGFMVVGRQIVAAGGDPSVGDPVALKALVVEAGRILDGIRDLIVRLTAVLEL